MTQTIEDLKNAFSGESQANRKYLAYAKKADDEGFPQIARLFRAAAHAETVHALNHFRALDGVKTTAENLQDAIAGENYEVVSMYPPMLAAAESAGEKRAARSFGYALDVEKIHEALYRKAAQSLGSGKDLPEVEIYVCPICGFTHEGKMTEKCPICGVMPDRFEDIA